MATPKKSRILFLFCLLGVLSPERMSHAQASFGLEEVASGFLYPVFVTGAGDGSGRLFVVERLGKIRIVMPDGTVRETPFLDLGTDGLDRVASSFSQGDERGLLGLAFHPDYEKNGRFYVHYSLKDPSGTNQGAGVISEFTVSSDPNLADTTEKVLLTVPQPYSNHNGGMIAFNPFDGCKGCLYIALGDGGSANDPEGNGQDKNTLLGSILRVDVDSGTPYGIPPDNPFVGVEGADEIFAYGLRNPWRFSFDRANGRLFVGDVGQNSYEEIDLVRNGDNLGWNIMEGFHCFPPPSAICDPNGLILPIVEYGRSEGISVTGGYVYRGSRIPSLVGKYVYGDYGSGRIWVLSENAGKGTWGEPVEILQTGFNISSFGEDDTGEIYVVEFPPQTRPTTGKIHRIVDTSPTSTPTVPPTATEIPTPSPSATATSPFTPTPSHTPTQSPVPSEGVSPTSTVRGDLDGNGRVDVLDLLRFVQEWRKPLPQDNH